MWRTWDGLSDTAKFKLTKIESGPLTAIVSFTSALNPVVSVPVGSQVSASMIKH
jgi:hypothetical protein